MELRQRLLNALLIRPVGDAIPFGGRVQHLHGEPAGAHQPVYKGRQIKLPLQNETQPVVLAEDTPVSMNVWALHSDLFPVLEEDFARWLAQPGGEISPPVWNSWA